MIVMVIIVTISTGLDRHNEYQINYDHDYYFICNNKNVYISFILYLHVHTNNDCCYIIYRISGKFDIVKV